ncbi:glycosyltransferase [Rubinisphaera margarita]|uniref:glycosyltransferase n=1 Tax=Rubinisphaera margarita TaxID=2909586 RepID=UPI001EE9083D|nr:glycosyltransferase [Rubinisphaera margarita]MCG6154303.1 glycosyltransferase [Rubinisphaera margarita]
MPQTPVPILFCITELDPGGAERAFVQLITRLDRTEWNPRVVCLSGEGELVEQLRQNGIEVVCLHASRRRPLAALLKLRREMRRFRPRLVQSYLFHANLLARIAARMAGVPVMVCGIRVAERRSNSYLKLDRWTDRWVTRHVCVSEAVRRFTVEQGGLPAEKLLVIPNGVDLDRFRTAEPVLRTELHCSDSDFLILFAGRLDPQKGVLSLPDLAERLKPKYPQLRWLIAGEGPLRGELKQQIQSRGLTETVQLLGSRDDIPELMKTADLFVFPSRWEGMPNVILEAMAAGLPIVSTAVEGIEDLLKDDMSGAIVPIGENAALAVRIEQLIEQPETRERYASQASRAVGRCPTWDAVAEQYQELYRELLVLEQKK